MKPSLGEILILLYISMCVAITSSLSDQVISSRNVNCSAYCGPEICSRKCPNKTKVIYVQGFVPVANDVFVVESLIPAIWVATEDVNGDCEILPDYMLQIELVNTECDPSVSSYHAMKSAEDGQHKYAVYLGGGCSLATEPLAIIAGNFYKIPIVSYGASSPSLSNREQFPNFYRTIPSEIQANSARFALMKKYNWTRVAALYETVPLFSLAAENFNHQYTKIYKHGTNLLLGFSESPAVALQRIKDDDVRIVMGYFYKDKAIATLCQAYHLKLTTSKHLWVLPAWYERDWYNTDYPTNANGSGIICNKKQMREAVKYSLFLDSYNESNATTDTGNTRTTEDFVKKLNCYLEEFRNNQFTRHFYTNKTEAHLYSGFTYDAVWMIAYALDKTERELTESGSSLTLEDIEYFEANNVSKIIGRHLAQTNFSGVSGPLLLDENGTRTGLTGIYQLRENPNSENELMQMLIAVHYPGLRGQDNLFNYDFTYLPGLDPKWKGDRRNAPRDRKSPLSLSLSTTLVYGTYISASVAFIIDVTLLIFNLGALKKPLIHNSAPHVNNVIIIGCGVMIAGSIFLGINSSKTDASFAALCTLRLWILVVGFTLSFGALFAKTWLVYNVYSNVKMKDKPFKMRSFVLIMMIFLVIDFGYLSFWTGKYPFRREMMKIEKHNQDQEVQYEICSCDNIGFLIGALFMYKAVMAICGLFLAYESRNVRYFYINDSRFVSITMYVVVILVGIGAPLSLVLAVNHFINVAFALAVFTIIAACMSCLLILFIPKFYYMVNPEKLEKSLGDPMDKVDEDKSIDLKLTEVDTCKPKEQNSDVVMTTSVNRNRIRKDRNMHSPKK